MNKTKKPKEDKLETALARAIAKAVRRGDFKLEGLDKTIFLAGKLSAPRIRAK